MFDEKSSSQIKAVILGAAMYAIANVASAAEPGADTREWIDLQTGGSAASPEARPMPGDIAQKTYQRYADSFAQPIPEKLGRESFIDAGGE